MLEEISLEQAKNIIILFFGILIGIVFVLMILWVVKSENLRKEFMDSLDDKTYRRYRDNLDKR